MRSASLFLLKLAFSKLSDISAVMKISFLSLYFLGSLQQEDRSAKLVEDQPPGNLPYLKPDDVQYFDKLLVS